MLLPPPFLHPRSCLAAELMLSFLLQCHMIFSPTSPLTWYITSPKFKNCVFQPCVFKVDQRFWAFDAQYSLSPSLALVLLPEKLGSPPGGHQAKRHTGEGRIYYLQQVRRTPGIFLKAASPQQQNWGGFKLRVYAYSWRGLASVCIFMKGLEQRRIQHRTETKVDRVQALADWSQEGQKMSTSSFHPPPGWGAFVPAELKDMYQIVMYIPWEEPGLIYRWTIISWLLFLCSCIPSLPLRSLITETRSRQVLWPGLDHKMAWAKNAFSFVKKALPGSFSSGTPSPSCLLLLEERKLIHRMNWAYAPNIPPPSCWLMALEGWLVLGHVVTNRFPYEAL